MTENMLFESLKRLKVEQKQKRLPPREIYLDESDGKIKERPLPQSDMAASAYINKTVKKTNKAKAIQTLCLVKIKIFNW